MNAALSIDRIARPATQQEIGGLGGIENDPVDDVDAFKCGTEYRGQKNAKGEISNRHQPKCNALFDGSANAKDVRQIDRVKSPR